MQQNDKNNQNNKNNKQLKQRRKLTPEESALRHVALLFFAIFGLTALMLDASYTSAADIFDQNYLYPFDKNDLNERRRDLLDLQNGDKENLEEYFGYEKPKQKPASLEDLIYNYQITPHVKVGADEYSGVDKETSGYVWKILKLDDTLTSQITNLIIILQNQGEQDEAETLAKIDELIKNYKDEIKDIDIPDGLKENTTYFLKESREDLIRRHDNLREAFAVIVENPDDTAGVARNHIKEIVADRDSAAGNLVKALKSAKKY